MIMAKLYELSKDYEELYEQLENIDPEADEAIELVQAFRDTLEWIKNYLLDNMRRLNESKIETPKAVLSIRNNPESVNISDSAAFVKWAQANNDSLLVYKEPEVSKSAVRNELKAGNEIPGVELQRTQTLQIR